MKFSILVGLLFLTFSILAQSPHGENFSIDCAACHNTENWLVNADEISFNHQTTAFPLEGNHLSVSCVDCHSSLVFAEAAPDCISCHQDIHRSSLGGDCTRCHDSDNWLVDNIPQLHQENGFQWEGQHASFACVSCHSSIDELVFTRIGNECQACHLDDYENTMAPNHQASGLSVNCLDCHSMEETAWEATFFDHGLFPLEKGHAEVNCVDCHQEPNYAATSSACVDCHQADYAQAANPDHEVLNFSVDCMDCHTLDLDWQPASFNDHDNFFPIYSGGHIGTWDACIDCHTAGDNFNSFECVNCHQSGETATQHNSVIGYVYADSYCITCHPTGEADHIFDHNSTAFPLDGAHLQTDCMECHETGFAGTPTDCLDCHTMDYTNAVNPNHQALNFSTDCASCHTTAPNWEPATFANHDDFYVLEGAHQAIENECLQCHSEGYTNTPNTCVGCHQADYTESVSPSHTQFGFPQDCQTCHTTAPGWAPAQFEIHDEYYVLEGAHRAVVGECALCHNERFTDTPTDCMGCHEMDFTQVVLPNHVELNFSTSCTDCHTQEVWVPSTFDHGVFYPLEGAHQAIENECLQCHSEGYTNTPNTCVGCHQTDYDQTENPNHQIAAFSTDCTTCHSVDSWSPSSFDHNTFYPLTGGHSLVASDCNACHADGYANTPTDCYACHVSDYTGTTNPNHSQLGFPIDCATCHTTNPGWTPSTFDHDRYYILRGAHAAIENECTSCHTTGYTNTPTTCYGCHATDYSRTTDPDHVQARFSTSCTQCHSETAWTPSTFNHDNYYVLRGAHAAIEDQCTSCHTSGYTNTPTTCYGCHAADYSSTRSPNHAQARFSTSCTQCHSETAWIPSTFNHDNYYVLRGAHAVIEDQCASCHASGYTNTPTTCYGCHATDYSSTRSPNHADARFSTSCTQCHSETAWIPSTFNHDNYYVLRGAHAVIEDQCASCHASGYTNTPTTCYGCHAADYNSTTNPNHSQSGFSTSCATCHDESRWEGATFDHDRQFFPIYSGNHRGEWNSCTECHTVAGNYSVFSCIDCHEHNDSQDLADEHRRVSGYIYESNACYACHPRGDD